MQPSVTILHGRAHAAVAATVVVAALGAAFACGRAQNIHDTSEAQNTACYSCHAAGYNTAKNPVHVNLLPTTCQDCHSTQGWSPAHVDNHFWWPLQNKHVGPACTACHTTGFKKGDTATDCVGCHQKDYDGATNPKHTGFPLDCKLCHTDTGFQPSTFNHPWPLDGVHKATACAQCHTGDPPRYKGTPMACADCHQKAADAAPSPIHKGLAATCADCHTPAAWKPSTYKHTWPLQGKHVLATCVQCHAGPTPVYKGTPTDCYSCHKADYDAAPTMGGGSTHASFPHSCQNCHQLSGWSPAISGPHPDSVCPDHKGRPCFKISTGVHADPGITCQDCHILAKTGGSSAGNNTDCIHCHLGDPKSGSLHGHVAPTIDSWHLAPDGGPPVPGYANFSSQGTTNYCLTCHEDGTRAVVDAGPG